ncbi:hypothetical protein JHK85_051185 [Glycine max]|nr:hypothetical protein JHK85_051185 [Glycine max]
MEDGYFKIRRGKNECGIEEDVTAGWPSTKNLVIEALLGDPQPLGEQQRVVEVIGCIATELGFSVEANYERAYIKDGWENSWIGFKGRVELGNYPMLMAESPQEQVQMVEMAAGSELEPAKRGAGSGICVDAGGITGIFVEEEGGR